MKAEIYGINGEKKGSIDLPAVFDSEIRPDLIMRAYYSEIASQRQPYGAFPLAGKFVSAHGKVKHARAGWRSHYGQGVSRVPKKTMTRRGTRFFWVGAFAPGTRGGRSAHAPLACKNPTKEINKKEKEKAIRSAIAATAKKKVFIVEDKFADLQKVKDIRLAVSKIIPKESAKSILIVTDKDLKMKNTGFNVANVKNLSVAKLAPNGHARTVLWTEKAIKELKL